MSPWRTRRRKDNELDEEIRSHLDMAVGDRVERGEPRAQAEAAARREMGNVTAIKEVTREMWGWRWLERLAQDTRYGLRLWRRSPAFSGIAILSLGLGIGANTAVFAVADALLLRPLPARDPAGLATLAVQFGSQPTYEFCYPAFERFRDGLRGMADTSAVALVDRDGVTVDGSNGLAPDRPLHVALVSGNYFSVMGVDAAAGRTLTPDDDRDAGAHPLAVVSDAAARRWYGGLATGVGRTFALNGTTYTIVGVTPPGFAGEWIGRPADVWIPLAMQSQVVVERPGLLQNPTDPWIRIVARLAPDVTATRVASAARVLFHRWIDDTFSTASAARFKQAPLTLESITRGFLPERRVLTPPLVLLLGVAGLLVLVACANVGSLQFARAIVRQHEMALRVALGAGRSRLFTQALTESLLLSTAGGLLGLALSLWGTHVLGAFLGSGGAALDVPLTLNLRTLAYAGALSLLAGCGFTVLPAIRAHRSGPSRPPGGGLDRFATLPRWTWTRRSLIAIQVATSLVLLIGAGLLARTWWNLRTQDVGFDREHVLLAWVAPDPNGTARDAHRDIFQIISARASALAGVRSVSMVGGTPSSDAVLGPSAGSIPIRLADGRPSTGVQVRARLFWVGPGIIDTLGMHPVAGRDFSARDNEAAPRVAIVSETLARRLFGTSHAIGQSFGMDRDGPVVEIAGVVKDALSGSARDVQPMTVFLPYRQGQTAQAPDGMCIVLRTAGNPAWAAGALRAELAAIDPRLRIRRIETLEDRIEGALRRDQLIAALSGAFALAAASLMAIGLYGIVSYTTSVRTRELGVRIALGADRARVTSLVLGENLRVIAIGAGLGLAAAVFASRLVAGLLFGVSRTDPLTMALAATFLIAVATVAALVPARRAARIDPLVALRME